MRGGLSFFRGAGAAARDYVDSDRSKADDYYLGDSNIVARRTVFDGSGAVASVDHLSGDAYASWVDWRDPENPDGKRRGAPRFEKRVAESGEIIERPKSPRFAEMVVNVDKTLSVAAALDENVSGALNDAQTAAAGAMGAYLAENSVARVGPRGAQRFVPIDQLEMVDVEHRTSRAGDPHRHIHAQFLTRVQVDGKWRGMYTGATLKQQEALRGIAEATINSHAGLRTALRDAGLTFDASRGRVVELEKHAELMSKRATQVAANRKQLESEWREENPGKEPPLDVQRGFDHQAWAMDRPRKSHGNTGNETHWRTELTDAGLRVDGFDGGREPEPQPLSTVDRMEVVSIAVARLESKHSAWSIAQLDGAIGRVLGEQGVVASQKEISDWVRDTSRTTADSLLRLELDYSGDVPQWASWITSERVVTVEADLRRAFSERGLQSVLITGEEPIGTLNQAQSDTARAIGGTAPLVVAEGAAGSGKTTMLREARALAEADGRRLVVVAPTLRAAQEAGASVGTSASSAHKLAHAYGYRWDDDGRWTRLTIGEQDPKTGRVYQGPPRELKLSADTRIVVDEAGMIDQDVAHALVTIADEKGASLAFIGDRAQLAAVGRGGVLDMAVAAHPTPLDLREVHRFRDPEYAELTLKMRERRDPDELFDKLLDRGEIAIHESLDDARDAITKDAMAHARAGASVAIATATNAEAARINAEVQRARAAAGHTTKAPIEITGRDELTIRTGDEIMTRQNDPELGVANRETWTVTKVRRNGTVVVSNGKREAELPETYVRENTHLAYASTEYGVQGATVESGHGVVTERSTASAVYVAATRGRGANTLHVVADSEEAARETFTGAMQREPGDRGLEQARENAERTLAGSVGSRLPEPERAARSERLPANMEPRRISGLESARTEDVELIAVVEERPDGKAFVDFEVNAESRHGRDRDGLHLRAERRTRANENGTTRETTNTWSRTSQDELKAIREAAGDNAVTLKTKSGTERTVYGFRADVEAQRGAYVPDLSTAQPSQLSALKRDVMRRQRTAEAQVRQDEDRARPGSETPELHTDAARENQTPAPEGARTVASRNDLAHGVGNTKGTTMVDTKQKLDEQRVADIRKAMGRGETERELQQRYGEKVKDSPEYKRAQQQQRAAKERQRQAAMDAAGEGRRDGNAQSTERNTREGSAQDRMRAARQAREAAERGVASKAPEKPGNAKGDSVQDQMRAARRAREAAERGNGGLGR